MKNTPSPALRDWAIYWSDKNRVLHRTVVTAATAQDAKKVLYARLGVKRLVGTNTQVAGGAYDNALREGWGLA
jgi:hypothetical protein